MSLALVALLSFGLGACPEPKGTPDPDIGVVTPDVVTDTGADGAAPDADAAQPDADAQGDGTSDAPGDTPNDDGPDADAQPDADAAADGDTGGDADALDAEADGPPPCPVDDPCDDGNLCTENDTCTADGLCQGTFKACDDGDVCTLDTCDPTTGDCNALPSPGNDCDDGEICTVFDICQADGSCLGELNPCDDGDLCTSDSCDFGVGCVNADACDDNDPCTTDSCNSADGACTNDPVAEDTPCDDGSLCTQDTVCQPDGACAGGTPTITCDDGNPCTLDQCEPSTGECVYPGAVGEKCDDDGDICTQDLCDETGACTHPPNPACGDQLKEIFECGANSGWTFTIVSGEVEWDIDGQPAPSDYDGTGCSLNFNKDAVTYASGADASTAYATSPEIDATGVPQNLFLAFWSYLDTADPPSSEWDNAELRISTDGFQTFEVLDMGIVDADLEEWKPIIIDLTAYAGSFFQLQFHFDSVDDINNVGAGWFVDNLLITGTLPTEICDDNVPQDDYDALGDCTDPDCALATNCLIEGDTCLLPFTDLDATSLPASSSGDTSTLGPHYGYDAGQCYGADADAGGAFLQGAPDAVHMFTPETTGQYTFTLDAAGFNGNLFLATDCEDIAGSCTGGANNGGAGQSETLSLHLEAATSYFVVIDGAAEFGDTDGGSYTLTVDQPAETNCTDGIDNDNNGDTDCDEAICALAPDCAPEVCDNDIDDDNDGLVDCLDPECNPICIDEICDNNQDDDDDGDEDCADSECGLAAGCVPTGDTCDDPLVVDAGALPWSSPLFDTTTFLPHYGDTTGACLGASGTAGGDLGVGAPDLVYSFTPQVGGVYTFTLVTGFDARLYVASDCADIGSTCRGIVEGNTTLGVVLNPGQTVFAVIDGASDADASQGGTGQLFVELADETDCNDSVDNDTDGNTDCDDSACTYAPNCVPETNCFDGIDNDFDGDFDCDDAECTGLCAEAGQCQDGIDNDGDGATDCEDTEDCGTEPECVPEICDNNQDDDNDGNTDCDDDECAVEVVCLPPGDVCDNALEVANLPFDHDGNTCDLIDFVATVGGGGCNSGGVGLGDSVYTYTAPENQVLWISLPKASTSADLQLNVASSCSPTVGECLAASDVGGQGGEFIVLPVTTGQTIFILVDGDSPLFQPSCGPYRLHIEQQSPEIGACDDGIDNDEDGFFDCADPQCQGDPVCACDTDADCDDANICTSDTCSELPEGKVCTFAPIGCDDDDACTANRCDPQTGCFYPAVAECPASLPYATDFHCGDLDWSFETLEGTVEWAIDGTPDPPGFLSADCSLNFNNGESYDSLNDEPSNGRAFLVPVDASAATSLWLSYADLFLAESTTFETRVVQVSADGDTWTDFPSGHISNQKGTWRWRKHDLAAFAGGGTVYVRFIFDSQDQLTNDQEGWFVDDLRITENEPGLGEVCDDGIDNDEDLQSDCDDDECSGNATLCP